MLARAIRLFIIGWGLAMPQGTLGADGVPAEREEKLPAPKQIEPLQMAPISEPMPHFHPQRKSRYDVWQYYGVDKFGYFKPRVIYSPSGAYYSIDGTPYPWVITHPREIMPYVVD